MRPYARSVDGPADRTVGGPADGPVDPTVGGPADRAATVELVASEVVRPLRRAVLRPGRPTHESAYPGEGDPLAAHAVARSLDDGAVLSVGTVVPEAPPWLPGTAPAWRPGGTAPAWRPGGTAPAWRIRGMATTPPQRGQGLGTLVLGALLGHVAAHGGGLVWCNARIGARTFYERAGFEARGDVFELPGIGPHAAMWRTVAGSSRPGAG